MSRQQNETPAERGCESTYQDAQEFCHDWGEPTCQVCDLPPEAHPDA